MVRFSCFNAHNHSSKPKNKVLLSAEVMHMALEDCSDNQGLKEFTNSSGSSPSHLKAHKDSICITADQITSSSPIKLEETNIKYNTESNVAVNKSHMTKSQSSGSGLDGKGRLCGHNDSEAETDLGVSGDGSPDHSCSVMSVGDKNPELSSSDQCPYALLSVSLQVSSDMVNNESIFGIGDPQQSEDGEGHGNSDTQFSGECAGESSHHTPRTPYTPHDIAKSCSLPNIASFGGHSTTANIVPRASSCKDLSVLDLKQNEMFYKVGTQVSQDEGRDDIMKNNGKTSIENPADDCYDGYNYVGSAKDWIIPVMDENTIKYPRAESAVGHWDQLPSKDFKIKRIQEWVMDLHHCSPLEENYELSSDHQPDAGAAVLDGLTTAIHDVKIAPGIEAAKRYISSLSATATAAQLANNGLAVIPFLSAFVSLKALNLSGNAIVRITAGALPRGLHILNLSKNNVSSIEGLRELTRLRVLDLSYNRILRIGHGLASCSSLRELYLAGNKISEVEGLHRLLKLNVLDLRFNKISTTKCLGQLAANYNSLQAISLEGNPAQKNVGDEQLKKYLQGLLPHLAYFNRQSIKAGTLKDSADRSARLGISAHQVDRGLRSELKTMRIGNHGLAARKRPSSLGRRSQQAVASPKPSRDRHGRFPPKTNV